VVHAGQLLQPGRLAVMDAPCAPRARHCRRWRSCAKIWRATSLASPQMPTLIGLVSRSVGIDIDLDILAVLGQ